MTIAGFLLGTVSGSGVATTVMLGSVAWPLLQQAGYPAEVGGAILSAAGIGAISVAPDAGRRRVPDRRVPADLLSAGARHGDLPTLLYYLSIFLMIEADSRRLGTQHVRSRAASRSRS